MRKFYVILLVAAVVVVSVLASTISIGYKTYTSGQYTYCLYADDTVEIMKYENSENETALVIPAYIDGYEVINISSGAFDCEGIESITIADEIEYIESGAFYNCQSVVYLSWPSNLVCDTPFVDLNNLYELTITFGTDGFMADYSSSQSPVWADSSETISTLIIADGVRYLSSYAFANLTGLTEVQLPETVEAIGKYCFYNDNSIESITLYYGLTSIGEGCFSSQKTTVFKNAITIPQSVTYLGDNALSSTYTYYVYLDSYAYQTLQESSQDYEVIDLGFQLEDDTIQLGTETSIVFNSLPSGYDEDIVYTSSDPDVVVVGDDGTLYTSGTGSCEVQISTDSGRSSQSVTVEYDAEGEAKFVRLDLKEEYSIAPLEYESFLYDSSETYTYTSSNPAVASVSEDGIVKGLRSGYATIEIVNQNGTTNYFLFRVQNLIASITVSQDTVSMHKGDTYTITARVIPSSADNTTLTYSSSDTDVAVVNSKGKITALSLGTCVITISSNDGSGVTATIAVSVTDSSITVETSTIATMVGKSFQLSTSSSGNQNLVYSSGDEEIATVDDNGRITGVSEGLTVITIANESLTSFTTVTVQVYEAVAYGIDISRWNGDLSLENFQAAKDDGIDFVMIRAGVGTDEDVNFEDNYENAKEAGLYVGVYHYTIATNADEAVAEAEAMIAWLDGKQLEYPIAIDIEDKTQKSLSREVWRAIVTAYCTTLENAGYYTIVYSYASMLNRATSQYDCWVAQWHTTSPYTYLGNYTMWQFTSLGNVAGFASSVDMDISFFDYAAYIKENHYNGY